MYKREQGAEEPGSEWNGPARIIGLENRNLWMIHNGTPIVGAPNRCRPPNASEPLACSFLNRTGGQRPAFPPTGQQSFVDVRTSPSHSGSSARKRPMPLNYVDRCTGESRASDDRGRGAEVAADDRKSDEPTAKDAEQ